MKRKELLAVITISLGEAPDNRTLREIGMTIQEYAEELTNGIKISIPDIEDNIEIDEIKARVKTFDVGLYSPKRKRMTNFEAIQEDGSNVTFAKLREDGSLVIQNRYYDALKGGFAGMDEVNLLPEGVQKLLKLLSERSPTPRTANAADSGSKS